MPRPPDRGQVDAVSITSLPQPGAKDARWGALGPVNLVTGVYTDDRCLAHVVPGHPERPERLSAAVEGVRDSGLTVAWPEFRPADPEVVAFAHAPSHVARIRAVAERGGGWIDPDTFVVPASYDAAVRAAGAASQALEDVVTGRQTNALVLVRPPGHHAGPDRAMGFCLFNNAAVAARSAVNQRGLARVAIVDIDVHHGNGTQEIFYGDPSVLYCSTHQYPFYPGTGALDERGLGEAEGTTVNVPLMAGCGDVVYQSATEQVLVPALRRYQPEAVIISIGFDAHWADPLAGMQLSLTGYGEVMTRLLAAADEVCDGRVVVLLEGGYDLEVLRHGAAMVTHLLVGRDRPSDPLGPGQARPEPPLGLEMVQAVRGVHGLK